MYLYQAHLLTGGGQVVNDLLNGLAGGAHGDDDLVRVGRAVIVKGLVVGAQLLVHLVHVLDSHLGHRVVVLVAGLAGLEEDVAVLGLAAQHGVLGVQGVAAEVADGVPVQHLAQVLIVPGLNLLDLMGGTEAVEEMQERHLALNGGQMGHSAQVHNLLGRVGAQHGVAGLAAGVYVGVVAKDVQGMGGHRAGGHMDDAGQQLAGDLIHIGDHQQEALRGGVGGGQRARGQRAVHSAGRAGLGLHLGDPHLPAEQVLAPGGGVLVSLVSHHGRGRDGVDGSHVGERVRDVRGGGVAIHCLHFSWHFNDFLLLGCWKRGVAGAAKLAQPAPSWIHSTIFSGLCKGLNLIFCVFFFSPARACPRGGKKAAGLVLPPLAC